MAFIMFIKVNVIADAVLLTKMPRKRPEKFLQNIFQLLKSRCFTNGLDSHLSKDLPANGKARKICVLPYYPLQIMQAVLCHPFEGFLQVCRLMASWSMVPVEVDGSGDLPQCQCLCLRLSWLLGTVSSFIKKLHY